MITSRDSIDIWHNILWSKYRGAIFSYLHKKGAAAGLNIRFFQIAETEGTRTILSDVDLAYHAYPFVLLYRGKYEAVAKHLMMRDMARLVGASDASVIVLAGYYRIEHWFQLAIARLRGKIVMVFCDSTKFDKTRNALTLRELLKGLFFRSVHGVFCYGERGREYVQSYGVRGDRIFVGCQAATLPLDYRPAAVVAKREAESCRIGDPVILFVGRLVKEKNVSLLLRAFAEMRDDAENCTLRVVGDGTAREALEEEAKALGVDKGVVFVGPKSGDKLYAEYLAASCLVLPSRTEPWGLVVNEALAFGCPAVVSDKCGCAPDLVREGDTGFVFRSDDVRALIDALRRALAMMRNDETTSRRCIEFASNYTPDLAAQRIIDGLERTIEREKTHSLQRSSLEIAKPGRNRLRVLVREAILFGSFGRTTGIDLQKRAASTRVGRRLVRVFRAEAARKYAERKLIFIHVPRNGGTSICQALYGEGVGHHTASAVSTIFPDLYKTYPSFAVLRDPVERFKSAYSFVRLGGGRDVDLISYWRRRSRDIDSVDTFIDFCMSLGDRINSADFTIRPQYTFVCNARGEVMVDHIFMFDKQDDIAAFLAKFGIEEIPRLNISRGATMGFSSAQIDRIRQIYSADVGLVERVSALQESQRARRVNVSR
jgi:glycosyltransferase involved in cell wall biosynthesis